MGTNFNKTIVRDCYRKIIRDLDLSLVDTYIHEDYIQHSPTVKTGRAGILEMLQFLKTLPKPNVPGPSPVLRVIGDGDFVAVHLDITFTGKQMAVIDLYRLQNGQLAEHWDAGQFISAQADEVITMTNGTTAINETADSDTSKRLIESFYAAADEAKDSYLSDALVDHNIAAPLTSRLGTAIKVHKIIGEGDFVVAQCEYLVGDKRLALYNIFRIEANKIAEHWSVEQEVPEKMAHGNGMF